MIVPCYPQKMNPPIIVQKTAPLQSTIFKIQNVQNKHDSYEQRLQLRPFWSDIEFSTH